MASKKSKVTPFTPAPRKHATLDYWLGPFQATPDGGSSNSPASLPRAASERGGKGKYGQGGGKVADGKSD